MLKAGWEVEFQSLAIPYFSSSTTFESSLVFSRSFKYMEWSCSLWEIPAHRSCGRVSRPHCWKQLAEPWMLAHEKDFDSDRNLVTISVDLSARGNILEAWNELLSSVCMSVTFLRLYSPVWLYIFFQLLAVFWRQIRGAGIGSQISPSLSNLAVTLVERSWSECFAEILRQKVNNYHDGLILWVKTWKIACSSRGAIASRPRGTEENFPLWKACQAYGQATSHLQPPRPRLQMQSGRGWLSPLFLRQAPCSPLCKSMARRSCNCCQVWPGGDVHVCQPPLPEIEGG